MTQARVETDPADSAQTRTDSDAGVEKLRNRLLDLTTRNSLLNYRHPPASSLRIVDELPDVLFESLVGGKSLRFVPVPKPADPNTDLREAARLRQISTGFELPADARNATPGADKHFDSDIQVLLFPQDLEGRLRKMRRSARTAIEESGVNVLYLALGFLEWFESDSSDLARLAPLVLVPVELSPLEFVPELRSQSSSLTYTDEDLNSNVTLFEKVRREFGISLPDLPANSSAADFSVESYLESVSAAVHGRQRWCVRRYVSLGFFQFANIYLWRDLGPDKGVLEQPLVRRFFEGRQATEPVVSTDAIEQLDERTTTTPLVYDADSSQHAVIESVAAGSNLLVEGPPGTGKSQTIANIIGACLAAGKSVLFVSEKLAALEVVRSKLEKAGLGEFCLELHSHKTSKRQIIDDLLRRLDVSNARSSLSDADALLAGIEKEKATLATCSRLWQTRAGASKLSIGEAMLAASRWRVDLEAFYSNGIVPDAIDVFRLPSAGELSQDWLAAALGVATQLTATWASTGANNPWSALTNADLTDADIQRLCRQATKVSVAFAQTQAAWLALATWGGIEPGASTAEVMLWAKHATGMPQPTTDAQLQHLEQLRDTKTLEQLLAVHAQLEMLNTQREPCLSRLGGRRDLTGRLALLDSTVTGLGQQLLEMTPDELARRARLLESAADAIDRQASNLQGLTRALNIDFELRESALNDLIALEPLLSSLPRIDAEMLGRDLGAADVQETLLRAASELEHIESELKWTSQSWKAGVDVVSAQEAAAALAGTRWYSWLSPRWHRARSYFKAVWIGPPLPSTERESAALTRYIDGAHKQRALAEDSHLRALFGGRAALSKGSCLEAIELARWQHRVRRDTAHRPELGRTIVAANHERLMALSRQAASCSRVLNQAVEALRCLGSIPAASSTDDLRVAAKEFARVADACTRAGVPGLMTLSEAGAASRECRAWLAREDLLGRALEAHLGPSARIFLTEPTALTSACALAQGLHAWCGPPAIRKRLFGAKSVAEFAEAQEHLKRLHATSEEASREFDVFCDLLRVSRDSWLGERARGASCEAIATEARRAASDPTGLRNQLAYIAAKDRAEAHRLSCLTQWLESRLLPEPAVAAAVHWLYYRSLLQPSKEAGELIKQFRGMTLDEIRRNYRALDEKLLVLRRAQVAVKARDRDRSIPLGVMSRKVGDLTELSLIRHEIGKKKGHLPVRTLVQKAARALIALKPCFMMGPLSVPVFLEPENLEFDILVFDEASQVKPEHALSAMARSKQMVIVGDSKQLPPTRFFDAMDEDDTEDHDALRLEQHESLLAAAKSVLPSRALRWHYRSRHQSLIQYSNHAFYDNDLIVFPSPEARHETLGVRLSKVAGTFDDRKNVAEADAVARAAIAHMKDHPSLSLGVVAMNAGQADYIDTLIDAACAKDPELQQYRAAWEKRNEPLFVKNLENVQGDERDAIFISFTYGPKTVGGAVPQRFGPINQEDGWRRLNVLYTRARSSVTAFTSMGPGDIRADANRKSLLALKGYLEFAVTGELPAASVSGRPADSDFELAVSKALRDLGYAVDHQVGVAGYFIDLGVRRSEDSSSYLLAVECDGATYHSSKVARDRDRLRQQILEGYGWQIHRIWSTDWFQDPRGQIEKLSRRLGAL